MTRLGVLACLLLVLSACGGGAADEPEPSGPGYEPVPDRELFARIAELPGVARAELEHLDSFTNPNVYSGEIRLQPGADARRVLDAVFALLWTGRHRATLAVTAFPADGGPGISSGSLGLSTRDDFEDRYGPQPGDGEPPEDLPAAR